MNLRTRGVQANRTIGAPGRDARTIFGTLFASLATTRTPPLRLLKNRLPRALFKSFFRRVDVAPLGLRVISANSRALLRRGRLLLLHTDPPCPSQEKNWS